MVRISECSASDGNKTIKLEGRVVGPCVSEVQNYCQQVLSRGLTLTIDMTEVSFLDRTGVSLLRELMSRKVHLTNCSPFLNELLKDSATEIR